jgi:hypothetical protein
MNKTLQGTGLRNRRRSSLHVDRLGLMSMRSHIVFVIHAFYGVAVEKMASHLSS